MTRVARNAGGRSLGPYSDLVYAGPLLLLSGRVGLVGTELANGIEAQVRAAIANAETVLIEAGHALDDVVRCTLYLVDMEDFDIVNETYAEFFSGPPPARTTIAVAGLPLGARFEIEMTALRRSSN